MPVSIVVAAVLQLLLATVFVVMLTAFGSVGPRAQRAADEEAKRQGIAPEALAQHGVRLDEGRGAYIAGYAIAAALTVLAALVLTGAQAGRWLSWILEPLVLIGVGYITTMQVFAVRLTESALAKVDDPRLDGLDIRMVLQEASRAMPSWFRPAILARCILATAGSAVVIALLSTASAGAYFA